jgi:hypothetical protein
MRSDDLQARPQPQVKGVAEHDLRSARGHLVRRHGLDRAVGSDRHEGRGLDAAVRELERAAPRPAVARRNRELHVSISMASP